MSKTALIIGSTGLTGERLLQLMLNDPYYEKVISVTRSTLAFKHSKLKSIVMDFEHMHDNTDQLKADHIYCCLGTTMKIAKSKDAFYKVDFTYPLNIAEICLAQGATKFLLVSALGANKNSFFYYSRVKGQLEEALIALDYPTTVILQPSLLLGDRKESRLGEELAKRVSFMFVGPYQAIQSGTVALVMLKLGKEEMTGLHRFKSEHIKKILN